MKRLLLFSFALALCSCGCSVPWRVGGNSRHEVWTYQGRPDGLVRVEKWRDKSGHGGGIFLLTDPKAQMIMSAHINQRALGGGSTFSVGDLQVNVDPQAGAIISAAGTAGGNFVGAVAKSAVGVKP